MRYIIALTLAALFAVTYTSGAVQLIRAQQAHVTNYINSIDQEK